MKGISAVLVLAVATLAMFAVSAIGQVPQKMNYQVMLTNDSDEPLADSAVTLVFRLYDQQVAGSQVWTETHNTSTNSIGVVSVTLGETVTLGSSLFDEPLWLEVVVDGETLTPRRELVSAPYALYANDSNMLGNELAEDYVLESDVMTGGVINTPSNPVDWTKLKNVPAGFADGSDDTGGSGDGHSLDAADGSPVDALYVDADGGVGIGVTSTQHELTLYDGATGFTYAQFANPSTGTGFGDGLVMGINATGTAYINQAEAHPMVFMTSLTERHSIEADGTFKFGSNFSNGMAQFHAQGSVTPGVSIYSSSSFGGGVDLSEENGDEYGFFQADVDGTGGYLQVYGSSGYNALSVDGSYSGGDPRVIIAGGSSGTTFNTFNSGDSAVELPFGSVSSLERNNEAGVNYATSTSGLTLDGSVQTLLSRSIYCPTSGYVLAIGTAEAVIDHTNGVTSGSYFGVSSSSSSFPSGSELYSRLPNNAGDGTYYEIITCQWLFQISSGTRTFYFLADEVAGDWTVYDRNLSLVFFPTYYGVLAEPDLMVPTKGTDLPKAELAAPISGADIAAERAECEAAYNAHIEAELAAMEAKLAEMRESLKSANQP